VTARHEFLDDDARLRAAEFALGILPSAEREELALHVGACPACRAEVERLSGALDALAQLLPEEEPAADSWERVAARLAEERASAPAVQTWKAWPATAPVAGSAEALGSLVPAAGDEDDATGWEATGTPGISTRRLHVDAERRTATMLIRMAPGASYPAHRHGGPEQCYVVRGELCLEGTRMPAGTYLHAAPGSVHGVQSSAEGCLLFIVSSLDDELLAPDQKALPKRIVRLPPSREIP